MYSFRVITSYTRNISISRPHMDKNLRDWLFILEKFPRVQDVRPGRALHIGIPAQKVGATTG